LKKHKLTSLIIALLFLFSISNVTGSLVQGESDNFYMENDSIAIKVVGGQNVPMYSFWSLSDTDTVYNVKFILLFEAIDVDGSGDFNEGDTQVPESTAALPAMSWIFSEIVTDDAGSHFNITSEGAAYTIQFLNHIGADANMKFDILIENYEFVSDSADVLLVLGFHCYSDVAESEDDMEDGENKVNFGDDGYFEIEPTADAQGQSIDVGISKGSGEDDEPMIYLAFGDFEGGKIFHDPTIGIGSGDDTTQVIPGPTVSLLVTIFVITNVLVIYRFKRKNK